MIVAFSTSCQLASVAVFGNDGELIDARQGESARNAAAACFQQMTEMGIEVNKVDRYVADVGPGSFAGVRVGVMLAKTLAWTRGLLVAGVSSFDLIAHDQVVSLPGRKGQWLVREPGSMVQTSTEFVGVGYGTGTDHRDYPHAKNAGALLESIVWMPAMELVPEYFLAPSISEPKTPFRLEGSP
ncbi:MAG: tRNA (adenosine(37)-N6)-threonylcarbamoyltransferase complex dimerization subunit type 1 TsaB [Chthonomonas sp.]|nr:tRNA (adenosine(37)-N6)-threonylcarbamoyltransferase complex dimerization subunit type 1 TsaB [Chthonomonas sp.]